MKVYFIELRKRRVFIPYRVNVLSARAAKLPLSLSILSQLLGNLANTSRGHDSLSIVMMVRGLSTTTLHKIVERFSPREIRSLLSPHHTCESPSPPKVSIIYLLHYGHTFTLAFLSTKIHPRNSQQKRSELSGKTRQCESLNRKGLPFLYGTYTTLLYSICVLHYPHTPCVKSIQLMLHWFII